MFNKQVTIAVIGVAILAAFAFIGVEMRNSESTLTFKLTDSESSSRAQSDAPQAIPKFAAQPTTQSMNALGERVADGDQVAFNKLIATAGELYRDINYSTERPRVMSNLILMKAAYDEIGEQAAQGNDNAFKMLKASLKLNHLRSFAPDALGIAAAAGNSQAMDILIHYEHSGIILSTAAFALRKAAEQNNPQAVDFFIALLKSGNNPGFGPLAADELTAAARKGNIKAASALERYKLQAQSHIPPATVP